MITLAQLKTWLNSSTAVPNVIVRVNYYNPTTSSDAVFKLSLRTFKDFLPLTKVGLVYSEEFSLDGTPKLSIGGLKFENYNGIYDFALNFIYKNKTVEVLIGDINWTEADYWLALKGTAERLVPESPHEFSLVLTSQLERLNAPISDSTFKDAGITSPEVTDSIIPILLGECCNIAPVLEDPINRIYRYSILPVNGLIEVREDSIPVSITMEDTTFGRFIPKYKVNGELTCSAQGHLIEGTTYSSKIGAVCKAIAKENGRENSRFLESEIDAATFSAFDETYGYDIGYYITSKENSIEIMQAIANSGGAQVLTTKTGLLRLYTLAFGTSQLTIESKHIKGNIEVKEFIVPTGTVSLNFCKNWTPQAQIKSSIPEEHKAIWKKEWRNVEKRDDTVIADYSLSSIATPIDTYLINKTQAENEAQRRLDFWKVPRTIYKIKGTKSLLWLNLCDTVTLKFPRYDLNNGKLGIIISASYNWTTFEVDFEVLV